MSTTDTTSTTTMAAPAPFSVLRADVWQALSRRLDEIVTDDALLGLVRDAALRPLRLLEAMAADAPAALGDDFFAAERLRTLLYLAAPWRALPAEAAQLAGSGPGVQPYQPGILHHGRLVIVGLAAVRVAPSATAADLLATVHGLALALSAAEVFGRLEPGAPDGFALETMLRTLVGLGDVSGTPTSGLLRPFALDATERGRWSCLAELFGTDALGSFVRERLQAEGSDKVLWDGASSAEITAVEPATAPTGSRIRLRGQFDSLASQRAKGSDDFQVAFVGADGTSQVGDVSRRSTSQLTVSVPDGARSGWIGVSDPARIMSSNRYRRSVRDFWSGLDLPRVPARSPSFLSCLREAPVPVEELADLGRLDQASKRTISIPPRGANNRFTVAPSAAAAAAAGASASAAAPSGSGAPIEAPATFPPSVTPPGSTPGDAGPTTGAAAPATKIVSVKASQKHHAAPFREGHPIDVVVTFRASASVPDASVRVILQLSDDTRPKPQSTDATSATFQIPGPEVAAPRLAFSVFLEVDGEPVDGVAPEPFPVTPSPLAITKVSVTQGGLASPFSADKALDVTVTYLPQRSKIDATTVVGDDTVATGTGTSGTAKLQIPAAAVTPDSVAFRVELFDDRNGQSDTAKKSVDVIAPLQIVTVTPTQHGVGPPFIENEPVAVEVTYRPKVTGEVRLVLSDSSSAPLKPTTSQQGRAVFQIPSTFVVPDTLTFAVQLGMPKDSLPRDVRPLGPFPVVAPVGVQIVLFRPTVLRRAGAARVDDKTRDATMAAAGRALGLSISVRELPWVEDPLAVIGSDVGGVEDPRIPVLFEALSRAATLTPGFESALWVALVPTLSADLGSASTGGPAAFETHVPAEAARTLAVCNPPGIDLLLRQLSSFLPIRPVLPRLRVVGSFDKDGHVVLEAAREETRAAGPGATFASGIVAVALDVDGRPLQRASIKTVRDGDVAAFVQLVPVSPEVELVQLRRGALVVAELRRPDGGPALSNFGLVANAPSPTLRWTYTHTKQAKPSLQFELLEQVSGETLAFTADPCFSRVLVPVQRLPVLPASSRPLSVRLVATDGWNTAFSPEQQLVAVHQNLIIRRVIGVQTADRTGALPFVRLTGVQWWADTTLPGPFDWSLEGTKLTPVDSIGRLVQLGIGARGLLRVIGRDARGNVALTDTRELE